MHGTDTELHSYININGMTENDDDGDDGAIKITKPHKNCNIEVVCARIITTCMHQIIHCTLLLLLLFRDLTHINVINNSYLAHRLLSIVLFHRHTRHGSQEKQIKNTHFHPLSTWTLVNNCRLFWSTHMRTYACNVKHAIASAFLCLLEFVRLLDLGLGTCQLIYALCSLLLLNGRKFIVSFSLGLNASIVFTTTYSIVSTHSNWRYFPFLTYRVRVSSSYFVFVIIYW